MTSWALPETLSKEFLHEVRLCQCDVNEKSFPEEQIF